jgi:uncharacterized protein (DUF697 family)
VANSKRDRAKAWVNGYTIVGTGIVVAAVVPGSTAMALASIEAHMCYEIGKIYRGPDYSLGDAALAASAIGIACVAGPAAALEAANLVPGPGWIVKGGVAGTVIKSLGEAIILHFESTSE